MELIDSDLILTRSECFYSCQGALHFTILMTDVCCLYRVAEWSSKPVLQEHSRMFPSSGIEKVMKWMGSRLRKKKEEIYTEEKNVPAYHEGKTNLIWILSNHSSHYIKLDSIDVKRKMKPSAPCHFRKVLLLHKSLFESDLGAYCRHDCTWFVGYLHGGRGEFSWNACSIRASVQGPFEKASPRSGVGAGKMTAKRLKNHANHWHMNKLCYGGVHDNDTSWDLRSFLWATTAFYQTSHRGFHCWRGLCRYTTKEKVSAVVHGQPANMELCHAILTF